MSRQSPQSYVYRFFQTTEVFGADTFLCSRSMPDAAGYPNPAPISVWVISGPYMLLGIAKIFASITSLKFAFTKVSTGLIHPKIHSILRNQRTSFPDLVFSLSKSLPYRHQNKRTVSSPPSFNSKTPLRPRWDSPLRR